MSSELLFCRNPQVESAPMRADSILFNPQANKFCMLNGTATLLWRELDRPRTASELAASLCTAYPSVTREVALRDVEHAIQQLLEIACVQNVEPAHSSSEGER